MTIIYSVFFGKLAQIPTGELPYMVFALSAIVLWQFFSRAVLEGSTSLTAQQALIGKIYFPRVIAPLTALLGSLVDFVIMLGVLFAAMLVFRTAPKWTIVTLPLWLFGLACLALGVSLLLAGLDAIYRDVRLALAFLIQVWYFLSPIIYPVELVPDPYRFYYLLNPATPFIQGFRATVLGQNNLPPSWSIIVACATTTIILLLGLAVFHRIERTIVDRI
jgi:lipopolysaccharide transport system permease protein